MSHLRVIGGTILSAVVVSLWAGQPGDLRKELDDAFQQGMVLRQQGKFGQAIPYFEKAAALAPKVFGPDHINTGHIIGAAGSAHYSAGNMQKSEALLRRSLEIQEAIFPKTDARLLQVLNNLSAAQDEIGKYDEAEKNIQRALAIQEARKPRDDLDISLTLNNYGVMLHRIARMRKRSESSSAASHCAKASSAWSIPKSPMGCTTSRTFTGSRATTRKPRPRHAAVWTFARKSSGPIMLSSLNASIKSA